MLVHFPGDESLIGQIVKVHLDKPRAFIIWERCFKKPDFQRYFIKRETGNEYEISYTLFLRNGDKNANIFTYDAEVPRNQGAV